MGRGAWPFLSLPVPPAWPPRGTTQSTKTEHHNECSDKDREQNPQHGTTS